MGGGTFLGQKAGTSRGKREVEVGRAGDVLYEMRERRGSGPGGQGGPEQSRSSTICWINPYPRETVRKKKRLESGAQNGDLLRNLKIDVFTKVKGGGGPLSDAEP